MVKRFGFGKKEKLKSRRQIDDLFARGQRFTVFPLSVTYRFLKADDDTVLQAGVTASKRLFKKAADRNRIKRLLREAYRLQKAGLLEAMKQNGSKGYVFFSYTDKKIASFPVVKESMNNCLKRLAQKLPHENPS
jgi:ribonuclease P protein component